MKPFMRTWLEPKHMMYLNGVKSVKDEIKNALEPKHMMYLNNF